MALFENGDDGMKRLFVVSAMAFTTALGCTQGTPGGPGTTNGSSKTGLGQVEDTFNLSVPVMSSSIQQGGTASSVIGIKRAKNFDSDVTLTFTDLPTGVTIEPASPKIMHGDSEAKIVFKAGNDAPLGDFQVKVTGHPAKGSDALVDFKLAVLAKDSFTLSVPRSTSSLKQGKTLPIAIGVNRQKTFDQDVELKFLDLPTGVTIEPAGSVVKQGEKEARFTLTALDDAALGSFAVKVTGHPETGADASSEFTLTVAKE